MIAMPIEQRTPEWFAWREQGITSTLAPIIMGAGELTPLQWFEKRYQPKHVTPAMHAGTMIEPAMLDYLRSKVNKHFAPACVENDQVPWLRTSLDALADDESGWAEFKMIGNAQTFKDIQAGGVITHDLHFWQCIHHQLVTGRPGWYLAAHEGKVHFEGVNATDLAKRSLFDAEKVFWDLLRTGTAPDPTDRDWVDMSSDPNWEEAVREYNRLKHDAEQCEMALDVAKTALKRLAHNKRARGRGVRVNAYWRRGNVDYAKVPELRGVDLEPFRKKATYIVDIRTEEEKC